MIVRQWLRVSRKTPCQVCKKDDWCTFTADGQLVCCMRVHSERQSKNGGWLHRVGTITPAIHPPLPPPRDRKLFDCAAYHSALRKRWDWRWCDGLALGLGVDMDALESLEPAYDSSNLAFAFPMRDGAGKVAGVRLRAEDGRKWAIRGGSDGLFYPTSTQPGGDLVICEGPTDTAAALTLGLKAVGRPSCSGGVSAMQELVGRLRIKSITIIADHDAPHRRPDGSVWYPGLDGAKVLAKALRRAWRLVMPPAKDIRTWLNEGATRDHFDALAASATWRLG